MPDAPECPELSQFPENQVLAIALLARGRKKTVVAKLLNIDRRTIARWLDRRAFADAVDAARDDALAELSASFVGLAPKAVRTLYKLMANHIDKPAAAFRAAQLVIKKSGLDRPAPPPMNDLRGIEIELGVINFDREGNALKTPPEPLALPLPLETLHADLGRSQAKTDS